MTDIGIAPGGGSAKPPRYGDVMGDQKRAANDWYQDQPEATEALLRVERFSGLSWDPACGLGTIPMTLEKAGHECLASDIVDRGYKGGLTESFWTLDFLQATGTPADNIISNPPFNLAQAFAERALSIAGNKVAFLLPLTFLEGMRRAQWLSASPLARVHVFSWRISMPPGELLAAGAVKPEGGKKAFAWFVFEHGWMGPAQVRFLHKPASICINEGAA